MRRTEMAGMFESPTLVCAAGSIASSYAGGQVVHCRHPYVPSPRRAIAHCNACLVTVSGTDTAAQSSEI